METYYAFCDDESIVSFGKFDSIDAADAYFDANLRKQHASIWLFSERRLRALRDNIDASLRADTPPVSEEDIMGALNLSSDDWDALPDRVRQSLADNWRS